MTENGYSSALDEEPVYEGPGSAAVRIAMIAIAAIPATLLVLAFFAAAAAVYGILVGAIVDLFSWGYHLIR